LADGSFDPRSFFSSFMGPVAGFIMSSSPIRVSCTTSRAEITPIIASQVAARLQLRQDRGDVLLDEQKVRDDDIAVAHRAPRFLQRGRVLGPFGGGMDRNLQPGNSPDSRSDTRAAGPAAWLSSVTITTR
jgi:hypothetical protein